MSLPPPIEEQRAALRATELRAPVRYRILHVGTYWEGETDIVRRMVEALRSLGHMVVAIDPRVWPALEVSRRTDVHAVELDVRALAPLVERFQPDVVIFNAGGFHPGAGGAAWLRQRGIPIVHIVLSDPDVKASTLSYLDRFDTIATNARACVEGYERAGAPVVCHMPFASDRSFVLRTVTPRPDWRAVAICVGHGRPDRQETMRSLASRFPVRVYGRKWDMPAVLARGDDLIAALDQGTFHVNFPRTLAGFTNVKVGVFESVARAGIVCTERTEEMAELFAFDEEVLAYSSAQDLAETIDTSLGDPGRIDAIRRRAFARLIGEHLYEHRWNTLFADLRARGILRAAGAPQVERHVLIDLHGDADLSSIEEGGAVVSAITTDPVRVLVQGFDAVSFSAHAEAAALLRDANVIIDHSGSAMSGDTYRVMAAALDAAVTAIGEAKVVHAEGAARLERALKAERAKHRALRDHPMVRVAVAVKRFLRART